MNSPVDPSGVVGRSRAWRATTVLIGLRIAYAYNWFDVGPALPVIGSTFGVGPAAWGLLLASFFLGAGLFQIPAGVLADRWGTRRTSLVGAAVLAAAAVLGGAAPSFDALLALRFVAGAGAGLFFSPAIALVASLHPEGRRGVPVGTFSSAFSAGAGLGVFLTAILLPDLGWRWSLAVGGIAMVVLLGIGIAAIPSWAGPPRGAAGKLIWRLPAAARSRAVWGIGLAFVGLEGASLSAGQFFVPYAQIVRGWSPALAGTVGALFVFPSVFGGPVGGRLAERFTNRRTQMALAAGVPALLFFAIPWAGTAPLAAIATTFSFSYGMVYAMMYILPPYLPGFSDADTPLAIGVFNAIQLAGGAVVAVVAGVVVGVSGYAAAWVLLGLLTLAMLAFLALVPKTGPGPAAAKER